MDQPVLMSRAALAVLTETSERFLRFAQDLHSRGNQSVTQDDLDALTQAIQAGNQALGKQKDASQP